MRIGIDVGGTFTISVLLEDATGRTHTYKCLTTPRTRLSLEQGLARPRRPGSGCIEGLEKIIHGPRSVINAIIEPRGAHGCSPRAAFATCSSWDAR